MIGSSAAKRRTPRSCMSMPCGNNSSECTELLVSLRRSMIGSSAAKRKTCTYVVCPVEKVLTSELLVSLRRSVIGPWRS